MTSIASIEDWPRRLEHVLATRCTTYRRVTVLRETESTQDAARRLNAMPGDCITCWRQTAGRGRLGRAWADTADLGLAITFVLDRNASAAETLAIGSAIGVARAVESLLGNRHAVKIKWPNDIMVNDRKLAGILIEQTADRAYIGVGLNVGQQQFSETLAMKAISLAQLGAGCDRLIALESLIPAIDASRSLMPPQLTEEFARRDHLRDRVATFKNGERTITGRVIRIDALRGLEVATPQGQEWLDAARTSVIAVEPDAKS